MGVWKHNKTLTREFLLDPSIRKLSDVELGQKTGIERSIVARYRKEANLCSEHAIKIQAGKELRKNAIPDWQIGLLVGTLLGDGSIYRAGENVASFRVAHVDRQLEYVKLFKSLIQNLCIADLYVFTDKLSDNLYYKIVTISHPDLVHLHNQFYSTGRKAVTQEVLDLLTVPGLVCWFYDDGSLNGNKYYLHTCSFTLEEHKLIRKHLFKRFGIKTTPIKISNGKKQYWSLYFAKDTVHILNKYLSDFYLSCFDYKLSKDVLRPSETKHETLWNSFSKVEDIVRTT